MTRENMAQLLKDNDMIRLCGGACEVETGRNIKQI